MATRWVRLRILAATGLVATSAGIAGLSAAEAITIDPKDLPDSMHGAVETQAITFGQGALSLFVDPGAAYAYAVLDRDVYSEDSVNFSMTARGANINLGTVAYAVLWAAPDCANSNVPCVLMGGYEEGAPNTGMHEAKGFPAYAEALYPPPPEESGLPPQDRVYKCIVNKDGTGSPPTQGSAQSICKQSDAIPMSAWAETVGDEYRATGFSRAAGFDVGVVKVGGSESFAETRPGSKGRLVSTGRSAVTDISILGGLITIESVKSSAQIVGQVGQASRTASCTFKGLTVAGQRIATTGGELPAAQLAPLFQQIKNATGFLAEIVPPSPVVSTEAEGGKQVTECSGMTVRLTDTRTSSPVPFCLPVQPDPSIPQCLPGLATRDEVSFGKVSIQQSVNDLGGLLDDTLTDSLSGAGDVGEDLGSISSTGGGGFGDLSASGDIGGGSLTDTVGGTSFTRPNTGGDNSGGDGARAADDLAALNGQLASGSKPVNSATIGMLTAAGGAGLILGVLVLVGTVNSLAAGRSFRLPGL